MRAATNREVRVRIPFPWTGTYYAITWDEMRKGRLWLCFAWWKDFRSVFLGIAVIPYFQDKPFQNKPCDHTSGPPGRSATAINPDSGKCELCGNQVTVANRGNRA